MSIQEIIKKEYSENDKTLCFKTTSVAKVIILSLVTGGIYDIILALNYWKSLKDNFGYKVSPFWRGFFVMFTNFRLFPIFEKYFKTYNIKLNGADWIAGLYLICTWADNKISLNSALQENTNWPLEITSLVLCTITALIFALIQNKINKINEQYYPDAPKNPWSVANTIWTVILMALWILTFLPA
jgi:hypothetical protein